jgi:transcriptional regulator of nitric oxide reductase
VYVYTNTTATLSYGSRPVLVQVSLMHKGGITGSGASSHGETVVRTIKQYVDQFAARIREANK